MVGRKEGGQSHGPTVQRHHEVERGKAKVDWAGYGVRRAGLRLVGPARLGFVRAGAGGSNQAAGRPWVCAGLQG